MAKDGNLVNVYEAMNLAEAQMIHDALADAGIESFVEKTASPLDGLQFIGEGTEVMVRSEDQAAAQVAIERFMAESAGIKDELGDDEEE